MKLFCMKFAVILLISTGLCAFSPSIVVQMVQHDTDRSELRESTFILENGILDAFFDAGYIVSSLPTTINQDVVEMMTETTAIAREGYMSYVVYISVFYHSYGLEKDETISVEDIEIVNWKVVSTTDMSVLGEGETDIAYRIPGENDLIAMRNFSNDLATQIKNEFDKIL